jgi:hypothetical protein
MEKEEEKRVYSRSRKNEMFFFVEADFPVLITLPHMKSLDIQSSQVR